MEHTVHLTSLPLGLKFPVCLSEKIHFDSARQQIVFHGFMSKREYDYLVGLSRDVEYQRAIDHLFRISIAEDSPKLRNFGRILAVLTVACIALAVFVWWMLLQPATDRQQPALSTEVDRTAQRLHSQSN